MRTAAGQAKKASERRAARTVAMAMTRDREFPAPDRFGEEVDPSQEVVERTVVQPPPGRRGGLRNPRLEGHEDDEAGRLQSPDTLMVTTFDNHSLTGGRGS
jgi:hypothetical protein